LPRRRRPREWGGRLGDAQQEVVQPPAVLGVQRRRQLLLGLGGNDPATSEGGASLVGDVQRVGAAVGRMPAALDQGHGSSLIWGIAATHSVDAWIPLMVFAFLFGLSMDYEVFIRARMREEYDATGSTDAAVIRGIGRTGRLVTSAALILFLAFASMASAPNTTVKVFATGLAAGIILDAPGIYSVA
jgi:hypothetical protein